MNKGSRFQQMVNVFLASVILCGVAYDYIATDQTWPDKPERTQAEDARDHQAAIAHAVEFRDNQVTRVIANRKWKGCTTTARLTDHIVMWESKTNTIMAVTSLDSAIRLVKGSGPSTDPEAVTYWVWRYCN